MDSTVATSHRPAAIQRGLEEGKVSRVKIGEKYYLVFKVEDGQITENPITSPEKLEKIHNVAKLALDTHKAAASSDPTLQDKEIIQLSNTGAIYQGRAETFDHSQASVTSAEDYLKATNDFAWQQEVINLEQHLDTLDDEEEVPVRTLPTSIQYYLRENDHREASYSPGDLEDYLLDYTREKIQKTHFVDAQLEDDELEEELEKNYDWVMGYDSAEELINESNSFIQQHFTAEHVWQIFSNILNDTSPSVHRPPEDDLSSTGLRSRSTSVSSSEYSSEEEDELVRSSSDQRGRSPVRGQPDRQRSSSSDRTVIVGSLDSLDFEEEVLSSNHSSRRKRSTSLPPPVLSSSFANESDQEVRGRPRTRSLSSSREHSRSLSRSTTHSSSRGSSPVRSRSQSPLPIPLAPQRADLAEKKKGESRIIILDEASIFPRETIKASSIRHKAQYMPREKGRLASAYRNLLPQINGPLAVVEANYQGAYEKLHRFQEDSERVELEPLSQQELVAIRTAHNRVMEIPDYRRHANLKDDRFFDAILDQLRLKL